MSHGSSHDRIISKRSFILFRNAELVQRQKVYQTRKAVAVVSCIAILSAAVGSGALIQRQQIKENYWNSLLNQTKYLVREAKLQLKDDQSILALQLALADLPSKELDRPVTAEAEHVLMQSLYAYYPPGGLYRKYMVVFRKQYN